MSPVMSVDGNKSSGSKTPDHDDLLDLSAQNIFKNLSLSQSFAAMARMPSVERDTYEPVKYEPKDSDSDEQDMPLDLSVDCSSENGSSDRRPSLSE